MAVANAKDLLLEVDLPKEVWGRSGRPTRGNMVRWFGFAMFALLGLALPWIGVKVIMIAGALAAGLGLPWFADQRLGAIEAEVAAATKSNAASLLGGLEERRLVALFAPHGWVALQKARLHLVAGDGRAGARALSECGRLCGEPKHPALLSGQARGFVISGDRAEARKLLAELAGGDSMTPRDHLDYGTILLGESGRAKQAREEIERAAESVGEHPQTDAALAIVRTRDDKLEEAGELLERAEAADDVESDVVAQDLIKKARKTLRPALKDAKKGIGGAGKKGIGGAGKKGKRTQPASDAGKGGRKKGRGKKKDKRKERREKRKAGRAQASGKHEALRPDATDEAAVEDDANPAAEAAADQAAADQAAADKAAADKAAAEKAAADKAAADKAAAEKAAADKAAAEKAAADEAAAEKAAADKAAADKAAADKAAADKAAADKAAADKAAADKAAADKAAEKAVADKAAADKAAADKAAADKAAADKAAADKAAADKAAADKAAADKAAADKAAADKAAADKAAATPAPPKLNSLFGNKPAGGKPLFKAPPLPKVGSGTGSKLSFPKPAAPKAGGMAKPKAPSLGAKPAAPAAPSVAPKAPPKVAAPKIAPPKVASAGDDDGWGDFLDDVAPPAKPKQD